MPAERPRTRVGLFGGSFDPPHVAHLFLASYALAVGDLEELLVVPCPTHPLGKRLSAWEHRFEMARLAFAHFRAVVVSDLEARLGPPTRTVRTLRALLAERPDIQPVLVLGADILQEADRWYQWEEIQRLAELLVVGRGGVGRGGAELELPAVSSTEIRRRLRAGGDVSALVPKSVLDYVERHGLYR